MEDVPGFFAEKNTLLGKIWLAVPLFLFSLTLLCPYFSTHLPCCALIFFRAHLPCCALFFFRAHLPCCTLIFFSSALTLLQIFFVCTYPAVPYPSLIFFRAHLPCCPKYFFFFGAHSCCASISVGKNTKNIKK